MSQYLSGPEWRSTMANGRIYWIHRLHLTPACFLNLFYLFFLKNADFSWEMRGNVTLRCMHADMREDFLFFKESHPVIHQICFNETMQVDNVSCKCIAFPLLVVEKYPPAPPTSVFFNAVRKTCYWCGPCSFPLCCWPDRRWQSAETWHGWIYLR